MANRYGNLYRIGIGIETYFASGFTSGTAVRFNDLVIHSGVIEMTPVVNTAKTAFKSLSAIAHPDEEKATTQMGNIVVRGDLTRAIFQKYILGYNDGVYYVDPQTLPSFVLLQIWSDTPAPAGTYKVNKASGAKLVSLVISGASGGFVQFEATFESRLPIRETAQAITGTDPGLVSPALLSFGDVAAILAMGGSATKLDSFSITLTNIMTADSTKFQNGDVIASPIIIEQGGEVAYVANYDTAGAEIDTSLLNSQTINEDIITLNFVGGGHTLQTYSKVTSLQVPDIDRDIFKINYAGKLVDNGVNAFGLVIY